MYNTIIVCFDLVFRRRLFNEPFEVDDRYIPLPVDRPGGFNWNEGAQAAAAAADPNDAAAAPRPQ